MQMSTHGPTELKPRQSKGHESSPASRCLTPCALLLHGFRAKAKSNSSSSFRPPVRSRTSNYDFVGRLASFYLPHLPQSVPRFSAPAKRGWRERERGERSSSEWTVCMKGEKIAGRLALFVVEIWGSGDNCSDAGDSKQISSLVLRSVRVRVA